VVNRYLERTFRESCREFGAEPLFRKIAKRCDKQKVRPINTCAELADMSSRQWGQGQDAPCYKDISGNQIEVNRELDELR